jgi:hypothetical protein
MSIREELDAMLDNLKGQPDETEQEIQPENTRRKSVYDSMSVDELLSALSDAKTNSKEEEIPENPSSENSGNITSYEQVPVYDPVTDSVSYADETEIPSADIVNEPSYDSTEETEKKHHRHRHKKKKRENKPDISTPVTEETAENTAETPIPDGYENPFDVEEKEPVHEEEIEPVPVKKGFLSGLKSTFGKNKKDKVEESTENEPVQEVHEHELPDSVNIIPENVFETENLPVEEDESEENIAVPEETVEEEIPDTVENIVAESDEKTDIADESDSDSDSDSADELIAGIREDAASKIAELESDKDENSESDVSVTAEKNDAPKKKSGIISALEKILEEDPDEISGERREKIEEDDDKPKRVNRTKRRLYAVLGLIVTAFAVVGVVSFAGYTAERFQSFASGESKTDGFTDIIYPAVIMDIEEFNSPEELSSEQIILASIWSLVMSDDGMDKYDKTFDVVSVPAIDVESYAAKLFGDSLPEITHTTVGSGEFKFYYNDSSKSYNVQVNPITFTYEPDITSVVKDGETVTLTVDYIKELPSWMKKGEDYTPEVSKTVEYVLKENGDSYVISSVSVINVNTTIE